MSYEEYMDMDIQDITNAIIYSGMPKEVAETIWIEDVTPFQMVLD